MLGRVWAGVPRAVQIVVCAEALVLGYGGIVHIVQLVTADFHPYTWAPTWLAVYFTSLTVLDPLAAVLLWSRRAAGLYLGAAVLVTDAVANGYASYGLPGGTTATRVSHAAVSLLAIAAMAVAVWVRPWLRPPWPDLPPA